MKWTKIKEEYPKSWDKILEWLNIEDYPFYMNLTWNDRNLYDFFDDQKIRIWFLWDNHPLVQWWHCGICCDKGETESSEWDIPNWKTRKETEEYAFLKAFEILEKQLTDI